MLKGGESEGTDPLECYNQAEVLKREKKVGGVTIDPLVKDGCTDRQFKLLWPH